MLFVNLSPNGYFAAPNGCPFRLDHNNPAAEGFIPASIASVQATVYPDYVADVHLALYAAPSTSGGEDGALVLQVDALATMATAGATLSIVPPAPNTCYVVRLWFDNALGGQADTVIRDSSVTSAATQALIPYGMSVSSFTVS